MTKKPRRQRLEKPDEFFSKGPLQVARFGKNVVIRSNWQEGEHAKMLSRLAARHPIVVEEIDQLIDQIANLVKVLPPAQLLYRAWWMKATSGLHIKAEAEVGPEDALAMRMIDYIQSIIASVIPFETPKDTLSDEDWTELSNLVEELFQKLNGEFHLSATAKRKIENENYDESLEEFHFKSQIYWCNVRGNQYQNHQLDSLAELLIPQSSVVEAVFGISSEKIIEELAKIWNSLTFGIKNAFEEFDNFKTISLNAMEADIESGLVDSNLPPHEIMAETLKRHSLNDVHESAMGKLMGMDLFDVEKLTKLPIQFLDEFSWTPGQDINFFSEGPSKGWPLRIWPTFIKPFIKIDSKYYCFDIHSLFDHFYRQIEKKVFAHSEQTKQQWIKTRKDVSEALPLRYFQTILPSSTVIQEAYYKWPTALGGQKQWCETDGLIAFDDHLFIIEVKAGAFTYTSPADDLPAYIESLKSLVQSPAKQGQRFLDYLNSAEKVSIYDKNHNEIHQLRKSDYRKITLCAITQDPFTEIAAQIQHLHNIGVDVGGTPVWSLSIDDLQVYADIFKSPLEFLHFVEQRMRAFDSELLNLDDELDHLGLYLKHNNYSQYAKELVGNNLTDINFTGYRSDIDEYFHDKLAGAESSIRLIQDMPARLQEIIQFLNGTNRPSRSRVVSYLLGISSEWRNRLLSSVDSELKNITSTLRTRPYSSHGDVRLTIFPWSYPIVPRNEVLALDHTKTVMLLHSETDRLLLEPTYDESNKLIDCDWRFITHTDISATELPMLKEKAEVLRRKRVSKALVEQGKIGRNEPCPCGSGKKIKKCCL